MNRPWVVLVLVLGSCPADSEDTWVGEWDLDLSETTQTCDGGEPTTVDGEHVSRCERNGAGVFTAGDCRFPLEVHTSTFAWFVATT